MEKCVESKVTSLTLIDIKLWAGLSPGYLRLPAVDAVHRHIPKGSTSQIETPKYLLYSLESSYININWQYKITSHKIKWFRRPAKPDKRVHIHVTTLDFLDCKNLG